MNYEEPNNFGARNDNYYSDQLKKASDKLAGNFGAIGSYVKQQFEATSKQMQNA